MFNRKLRKHLGFFIRNLNARFVRDVFLYISFHDFRKTFLPLLSPTLPPLSLFLSLFLLLSENIFNVILVNTLQTYEVLSISENP